MSEGPVMVVGVAWYRRDEYELLRAVSTDADQMENTYDEWLACANKTVADLARLGTSAVPVDISVRELAEWCKGQGKPLNGGARAQFVSEKMRLRQGGAAKSA